MKTLATLEALCQEYQSAQIRYLSGEGILSERKVNPLALCFQNGEWSLIAYCHLRQADREFKLERIKSLKTLDEFFAPRTEVLYRFFSR